MPKTVEFRVQQPGRSWEDTEVTWVRVCAYKQQVPQAVAKNMANMSGKSVRWNWVDSPWGYYAHPDHIVAIPLEMEMEQVAL